MYFKFPIVHALFAIDIYIVETALTKANYKLNSYILKALLIDSNNTVVIYIYIYIYIEYIIGSM